MEMLSERRCPPEPRIPYSPDGLLIGNQCSDTTASEPGLTIRHAHAPGTTDPKENAVPPPLAAPPGITATVDAVLSSDNSPAVLNGPPQP